MNTYKKLTTDRFIVIIGIISMVFIVVSRLWKLNKGLIFSDEGWYAVLLRDNPSQNLPTRFFKLFQFGFQNDIFALRLMFCVLLLASIAFFGYSVYRLQRSQGQTNSLLFCLSVVAIGSIQAHSISTPNYINMNLFFGLLSVSFFMLWVSNIRWYNIVLSTFFASFLFTTQVLGIILLPVIFILLFFYSQQKIKDILFFILGIILFFCVFFLLESPTELVNSVSKTASQTVSRNSSDYGIVFLIKWSFISLSYMIKFLIGAYLFSQTVKALFKTGISYKYKIALAVFVSGVILIYLNIFITPHCHKSSIKSFNQLGIPFFLLFWCLCNNIKNVGRKEILITLLLVFATFAMCFGTNTEFLARYSTFIVFLLPAIFIFAKPTLAMKKVAIAYFSITLIVNIATINKPNWLGDRPSDQNIPLKTIGINQNINLTKENINQLQFCKNNIDELMPCYSSEKTWGLVHLLNYKPISYSFRLPNNEQLSNQIQESLTRYNKIVVISINQDSLNLSNCVCNENIIHTTTMGEGLVLDFFSVEK